VFSFARDEATGTADRRPRAVDDEPIDGQLPGLVRHGDDAAHTGN
jgi:hypothetical protein